MKISPLPFAGESQTLHSWQPAFLNVSKILAELAENLTGKSFDFAVTYGGALSGSHTVSWARYRTLEPLCPMCHLDINMDIGFSGTAAAYFAIDLPIAPARDRAVELLGAATISSVISVIAAFNETGSDNKKAWVRKADGTNWASAVTSNIRLTGWYDYGN